MKEEVALKLGYWRYLKGQTRPTCRVLSKMSDMLTTKCLP